MSEINDGWGSFEVIPGANLARRAGRAVLNFIQLPSGGYPSEYPKHPERLGEPAETGAEAALGHALIEGSVTIEEAFGLPILERPEAAQMRNYLR